MSDYLKEIDEIIYKQVKTAINNFEPALSIQESKEDLMALAFNHEYDVCVGYKKLSDLVLEELSWVDDHMEGVCRFENLWLKLKKEVEQAITDAKQNLE